ncbi:hypothetical protein VV208B2_38150 [Vibrio vulnificus]|nr:hypothetical protein VV208B2_38150 [Vibrio vulnificus]
MTFLSMSVIIIVPWMGSNIFPFNFLSKLIVTSQTYYKAVCRPIIIYTLTDMRYVAMHLFDLIGEGFHPILDLGD